MFRAVWLAAPALAAPYDVAEKDIATLQADMAAGKVDAVGLVQAYQARIAAIDPQLHSVFALNPDALAEARALDAERKAGHVRGPLHGIPILVKDNIETLDPIPTTAGSLALANNITHRDAPVVARLRAAGAIILGKTNLSEWANIRSTHSISGWSAIGGWTHNPYVLDRSTCGSSAGSGAAVAASLAAAALGTETNGSLVCPGAFNSLVSLKPTVGLVSRTHIVPISHTQDTAGPMARSVRRCGAAAVGHGGQRSRRMRRRRAPMPIAPIMRRWRGASLKGKRLGVILPPPDQSPPATEPLLQHALGDPAGPGRRDRRDPRFRAAARSLRRGRHRAEIRTQARHERLSAKPARRGSQEPGRPDRLQCDHRRANWRCSTRIISRRPRPRAI